MEHIILDVDGTLWDSTEIIAVAWTRAIRQMGIERADVTAEELKKLFGKTMDVIASALLPNESEDVRKKVMDVCCMYEHEALQADPCQILYPGVRETIVELSKTKSVYIVSNCQCGYIELFLEKTGLGPYIQDTECFGNTGRQKGENIRLVMERNGIEEAVYVGDTLGDYEAAQLAEVPFVFASYGFGEVPDCWKSLKTFAELKQL